MTGINSIVNNERFATFEVEKGNNKYHIRHDKITGKTYQTVSVKLPDYLTQFNEYAKKVQSLYAMSEAY